MRGCSEFLSFPKMFRVLQLPISSIIYRISYFFSGFLIRKTGFLTSESGWLNFYGTHSVPFQRKKVMGLVDSVQRGGSRRIEVRQKGSESWSSKTLNKFWD